jgi:hypothetical protein
MGKAGAGDLPPRFDLVVLLYLLDELVVLASSLPDIHAAYKILRETGGLAEREEEFIHVHIGLNMGLSIDGDAEVSPWAENSTGWRPVAR